MSALSIQPTYPIFTDIDGQPLEAGYVWIGTANLDPQTNPVQVYWDAALTILAPQPIRTLAGYPSNSGTPARLYVNSDYSIRVMNRNGSTVYSAPTATERYNAAVISQILGSNVTFIQSGAGAEERTMQNKARDHVSVFDFMTETQIANIQAGVSTDDTAEIQAAIDAHDCVYFPPGTYRVTHIDLRSNSYIFGDGKVSKIKQIIGTLPRYPEGDGIITMNLIDANSTSNSVNNMTNIRIRDIGIEGNVVESGFYETMAAIGAQAVSLVYIEGVYITAFQGDGICFYSGVDVAAEKHCENLFIRDCYIDGVNFDNRNGISFYDCTNGLVEGCYFTRCTRANMPSAIDFEGRDFTYVRMRNMTVRNCYFQTIGVSGTKAALGGYFWKSNVNNITPIQNFLIEGNTFQATAGIFFSSPENPDDVCASHNIVIRNNAFLTTSGNIAHYHIKGITYEANTFDTWFGGFLLGLGAQMYDMKVLKNTFKNCALTNSGGTLFNMRVVDGLEVAENVFINCGAQDGSAGSIVEVVAGAFQAKRLTLRDNRLYASTTSMKYLITAANTLDQKSSNYFNNQFINTGSGIVQSGPGGETFSRLNDFAILSGGYSISAVPNDWPIGFTANVIFGGTQPSGSNNGLLETLIPQRVSAAAYYSAYQRYYASDGSNLNAFWQRRSNSDGTAWGTWYKFTGV